MIRALAISIAVLAQSGDAVRTPVAPPAPWVEARLAALRPERPVAYLELAEDLMDRAGGSTSPEADRALARHLAALAGAIDIRGTGRSAALFLLEHAPLGADQSRLRAIASLLDPSTDRAVEAEERSDAAMALLQAFSHYRRGEGGRAKEWLERAGAAALLDRHPTVLPGGSARFRAECDAMRQSGPPIVAPAQVEALHALVAAAASGEPRSWSEAIVLEGPAPLPELNVSDPGAVFGVDPRASVWRSGAWAAPSG
ncbi:MAG: hypothetical protein ACKOQW_05410 [Phycisphaerales bacterium]